MNTVQITTHCDDGPGDPSRLQALVHAICDRFGLSGATISVGIVDDAEIRRYTHLEKYYWKYFKY